MQRCQLLYTANQPYGAFWHRETEVVAHALSARLSVPCVMDDEREARARFGYALGAVLKERQLSERAFAARIGVDPRKVARWRAGKAYPDYSEARALMRELGVTETIFNDPPQVPDQPRYPIERFLVESAGRGLERGLRDRAPAQRGADGRDGQPVRPRR